MEIDVKATGAIADGSAHSIVQKALPDIEQPIADDLMSLIRADLRTVLRNPTGRYQSRSPSLSKAGDDLIVDDGGVIYGLWLEGVSSRNARTRFKGYATFRRMAQKAQDRAAETASRAIKELVGRLNK